MTYAVEFDPTPLWQGRTEYYRYTLHRAVIEDAEEGVFTDGYVLRSSNGTESDVVEAYGEYDIEPGNGLYADQILDCRVTSRPLPAADRREVERFAELFANLCESGKDATPLVESEILM